MTVLQVLVPLTMPVHCNGHIEIVLNKYFNVVALVHINERTGLLVID